MNTSLINITGQLSDPYTSIIKKKIIGQFPIVFQRDSSQVLEGIMKELLASAKLRFGPLPSPESIVRLREIVRKYVAQSLPIPLLVPWGSKKVANGYSVDTAELSAIKMLTCLGSRVEAVYTPGTQIVLRVEDLSGFTLFKDEGQPAIESSNRYVDDLEKLVRILNPSIKFQKETLMHNASDYEKTAEEFIPIMHEHLKNPTVDSLNNLKEYGWKGDIPQHQLEYYLERYAKIYGSDAEQQIAKLAVYFGTAWARHKLNMIGDLPEWEKDYIQINFAPPVPGAPTDIVSNFIHYRTTPSTQTRDHLPPWRAKGFLEISEDRVKFKLASWRKEMPCNSHKLVLEKGGESITLNTRYLIKE